MVVDVGAATHGSLTEPYAPLLLAGVCEVIGFEPDQPECERVRQLYASRGWPARFHPVFVGDGAVRPFHITNWGQTASLYPPNEELLGRYENLLSLTSLQKVIEVQTHRLDDLVEECDFLKMDVQGAELDVLRNARSILKRALIVWLEVEFLPLYRGQPLFSDVDAFLRQQGFQFLAFDYFGTRRLQVTSTSGRANTRIQQLWADAIYIADPELWSKLETPRLCKLAVCLELIGAYDHVEKVLELLEARGVCNAEKYRKRYYLPAAISLRRDYE